MLATAALMVGLFPGNALAADTATCSEIQVVNRHSGIYVGGAKQGTRANLEGQTLNYCLNSGGSSDWIRASMAWVNVQGQPPNDIVQIGVGKCTDSTGFAQCNGQMSYLWGWGRGSCGLLKFPSVVRLGAWAGTTQDYFVTHGTSYWRGYIAGTVRGEVANSEICWTPQSSTWFAETWDYGDALGGSAGNKYAITSMRMQNTQNGTWTSPGLNAANDCSVQSQPTNVFVCDITAADAFQTWTTR